METILGILLGIAILYVAGWGLSILVGGADAIGEGSNVVKGIKDFHDGMSTQDGQFVEPKYGDWMS